MAHNIPGPHDPDEMRSFLDTFLYTQEAFLVDEIVEMDAHARQIRARMDTKRLLPFAQHQRVQLGYPLHVSGPELIMATANVGCLHLWFFHDCRWDDGWVAFGSRIEQADFERIALVGPPLEMRSRELRSRVGPKRITIWFEFEFSQEGKTVYSSHQTATFLKFPPPTG